MPPSDLPVGEYAVTCIQLVGNKGSAFRSVTHKYTMPILLELQLTNIFSCGNVVKSKIQKQLTYTDIKQRKTSRKLYYLNISSQEMFDLFMNDFLFTINYF